MDTGGGTSGREASIWRKRAIFLNYRPSLGETMPTRDVGLWEEGRDYSKKIRVDLITTIPPRLPSHLPHDENVFQLGLIL